MPDLTDDKLLSLATSIPIESDKNWWSVRAWVMAHDFDKRDFALTPEERLAGREN